MERMINRNVYNGKFQSDDLYFECQGIFMYRLEEFLFVT